MVFNSVCRARSAFAARTSSGERRCGRRDQGICDILFSLWVCGVVGEEETELCSEAKKERRKNEETGESEGFLL